MSEKDRNYPPLKHFKRSEFACPTDPTSGDNMCPSFLQKLDEARDKTNIPYYINSGYRSPERNKEIGGVENSSHTKIPCKAADIRYRSSRQLFVILLGLMSVGFTRFGIGRGFIHVDGDKEKSPNVMWTYYK